ncbi:hypothetical protein [Gimesia sp.]|uniref:hypothetical protein n=1 Tax=Gimesia sp. TaxID=2024833 RepID=UPI0025C5322C|nr:hypothetical protein [Gimesia sp.]|tara:strand:- start:136 stop:753 length:618 start_codon:yes stop_codon:yes gene_type:complete
MKKEYTLPTEKMLRTLSPPSIAAYATRCALRVQPFLCLCNQASYQYKRFVLEIDDSLNLNISFNEAEDASLNADELLSYATELSEKDVTSKTKASAISAAHAFKATAYIANDFLDEGYDSAIRAADNSMTIFHEMNWLFTPVLRDYDFLKDSRHGDPIDFFFDCSDAGLLGELWYGNPPDWYLEVKGIYDKNITLWKKEILKNKM